VFEDEDAPPNCALAPGLNQRNGFRTRGEAGAALDEALRRVRLGPLFKPRMTLRELDAAYLEQ
jgi:hypothetical protein